MKQGRISLQQYRHRSQTFSGLERKAYQLGKIEDERRRLAAAAELLTELLERSQDLIALCCLIRAETGLIAKPE